MRRLYLAATIASVLWTNFALADWPMYRGDSQRSGYTAESLPAQLQPQWTYRPTHPPQPAWPREQRAPFDRAFHVAVAHGMVFFGSSADGTVTALDAQTGSPRWSFPTAGPVRFAPAIWNDRLFVVSDDGHLYCLSVADGKLIRKWRGGPSDEKVLGNQRIVSRWPARGGPAIVGDTVYYGAGVWQSEGVYLYAIDARSGKTLWVNDSSGGIYMPQPHGGANAESGVTSQGHLLANQDQLLVPTGRAVPAAFNRADGKFQYYHLQENRAAGGTEAMLYRDATFSIGADYAGVVFDTKTGEKLGTLRPGAFAATPEGVLHADGKSLNLLRRKEKKAIDRRGNPEVVVEFAADGDFPAISGVPGGVSLIVAGRTAISGSSGQLTAVNLDKREVAWTKEIEGTAYGLAAADGRLFVSTDDGAIHCYAAARRPHREITAAVADQSPYPADAAIEKAADEILRRSGITEGYCVDLGCGDGALAYELARRTKLHIIAVESDPQMVATARARLTAAGLYGPRVMVLEADPANAQLPKYIANLVVSARSINGEADSAVRTEGARVQRPHGGALCLGPADDMQVAVRSAVPSAGSWTHQYSNAGNTGCTIDEVKGPLRALWYRDIDLDLPQRHGRGPAPLYENGRMFAMGMDAMVAVDAYNGRVLWRFEVPGALTAYNADHLMGTAGTGSNFCVNDDSVYVRSGGTCYRLDARTGKKLATFQAPKHADGKAATWGYIACSDGVLYGSAVNEEHIVKHSGRPADMSNLFTESKFLFAFDVQEEKLLWRYDAESSIRHNSIALGNDRVYLIDRPLAQGDLLSWAKRRGEDAPKEQPAAHPTGKLVALDARTGKAEWTSEEDIFGTVLQYSEANNVLLMSYQSTRFKLPSELGGRLAAFRGDSGYRIWEKKAKYVTRTLINEHTIYAQGGAWDLLTGEDRPFDFSRSYGCGQLAGSKNLLLFRSATLGYFDFSGEKRTHSFGGVRPGCWINTIPVGGLVLVPDASAGCTCSYQTRAWLALQGE